MIQYSFVCSQSYSYLINYQIQSKLYQFLDKNTEEEAKWLRLSGISVLGVSSLITVATRITGIAEVLLKGVGLLCCTPFSSDRIRSIKTGLHEIFAHTPKNILRTAFFPIEFTVGFVWNLIEPKLFTLSMVECMKVNLLHAQAGTLHSAAHEEDLVHVAGRAYPKLLRYQQKIIDKRRAENSR